MTAQPSYEELTQSVTEHARIGERNHRILNLSPAIIYTCSIGETYPATFVSKSIESVLGYDPLDFTSNPNFWADHIHPEDHERVFAELPALFEYGRHIHEYRFRAKDGKYLWMRDELNLILDDQGNEQEIIGYMIDITEQKNIEEQLVQAQKMEAIGNLAGGIAHDFNNILTSIIGFSEVVKIQIQSGDGDPEENIDQVLRAGKRATELVKQILTFSRREKHKLQPLMPHLAINEALKMLHASLPTTIEIKEDIDTESGLILGDQTKILQIIMNLCTNAMHAMENEKGILSVSLCRKDLREEDIREEGVLPGPFIILSISDTGVGMAKATKDRIFEPYFTTKKTGEGTGLGLSVIHGIIKEYKGFICVDSEPGKGTTFHIHFPALLTETFTSEEKGIDKPLPTGNERVLVVDDESSIVTLQKSILEELGYKVVVITDSLDALDQVRTNPDQFDLIVTDQTMPNLSGFELTQEILKIRKDMPIIISTGYSTVLSEEEAIAIGIKKYLSKPIGRKKLARTVRMVLDENEGYLS